MFNAEKEKLENFISEFNKYIDNLNPIQNNEKGKKLYNDCINLRDVSVENFVKILKNNEVFFYHNNTTIKPNSRFYDTVVNEKAKEIIMNMNIDLKYETLKEKLRLDFINNQLDRTERNSNPSFLSFNLESSNSEYSSNNFSPKEVSQYEVLGKNADSKYESLIGFEKETAEIRKEIPIYEKKEGLFGEKGIGKEPKYCDSKEGCKII